MFSAYHFIFAERLPLKFFTTADGLANDSVNKIVNDSHGFLWFCTGEGLSRFDGNKFKNYTQVEGLPHRNINDLLETDNGDYLIATSGGLAVFNPLGKAFKWNIIAGKLEQTSNEPPIFKTFLTPDAEKDDKISKSINSLAQDGAGNIFAGTNHGLFRISKKDNDWQFENIENTEFNDINSLFTDSRKDVWIATPSAVFLMPKTGEIRKITETGGNRIFETQDGKIWIDSGGNDIGIRVFERQNEIDFRQITLYTSKDGLPKSGFSNVVAETASGRVFVSSDGNLCEFSFNGEPKFRVFEDKLGTAETDNSGNIWFTTAGKGAARFSPNSFEIFDERDGIPKELITSIFGNKNGEIFLTVGKRNLVRAANGKFESLIPFQSAGRNWIDIFLDLQSQDGEFWIPTIKGLLRFPKLDNFSDLANTKPKKIYTKNDGLFSNEVFNLFEDSRGDIWINAPTQENSLSRWEKSTERIYSYTVEDGLPKASGATAFGEDAAGNVWINFYFGQIVRYQNGKFRSMTNENLLPTNTITKMISDKQGRFWLATGSRGLFRVDNPNDETPSFNNFSTADGLSSNLVLCLTSDEFGKIYVGTGRGINRIEPENFSVKIYTQNDGLPGNTISQCYTDANGNLWFSSNNSLIKYVPTNNDEQLKPTILINGINVNGKPQTVSELGAKEVNNLKFEPDEKQIRIDFFAISQKPGENLKYQYKLGEQDWSAMQEQQSVDFNLSAGTYIFAVRAVNSEGISSENPAIVSFTIQPPIFQRWWFLLLSSLFVFTILYIIYRRRTDNLKRINAALTEAKIAEENLRKSREERLAELQRVRTRIATDLHDDIGSSLTQITVYSELARQREHENGTAGEPLNMISNVANELVDTMSDIVWAINPKKDHLQDLTQRMRRFAANVLTAKDIEMTFRAPDSEIEVPLGANIRREVFLIFKETVNNIVKHSEATEAEINFSTSDNFLTINFRDNGKGFDQTAKQNGNDWKKFRGGNGLINMQKRAADLGGSYEIESEIGNGTNVVLNVPLDLEHENIIGK